MSEVEQRLQRLTNAVLGGKTEDVRQSTYAALAKGSTANEILDALIQAVNIIVDLVEVGEYDQDRLIGAESTVNSCLQVIEEHLARAETRFGVKATVGPVGVKAGSLLSLVLSAVLRSAGFKAINLGKTQTPLDILRNSEELGAALVVPLLQSDGIDTHLQSFIEEVERGGFKSKFEIIPVAPGLTDETQSIVKIARDSGEVISKATEWALKKEGSLRGV